MCSRDNVNKYANYMPSSIQMNLCGSLKFCSKLTLTVRYIWQPEFHPTFEYFEIRKWCTNTRGFMSTNFSVEFYLWVCRKSAIPNIKQYTVSKYVIHDIYKDSQLCINMMVYVNICYCFNPTSWLRNSCYSMCTYTYLVRFNSVTCLM